jgi:hypothetical protein
MGALLNEPKKVANEAADKITKAQQHKPEPVLREQALAQLIASPAKTCPSSAAVCNAGRISV